MNNIIMLAELKKAPIAHTDAGDFLFFGSPRSEFYVKGQIVNSRAGLFFLDIEGEKFTTHKLNDFEVGEEVICIINPKIENETVKFILRSLEKIS